MKRLDNDRGYTLLEVLIGLFLTGLIAAGGFEFYATMHNQRIVQEDISDMQLNARNSLQEMVQTLRMGGYKIGAHPAFRVSGDSLYVFYSETQAVDTTLYYLDDYTAMELSRIDEAPSGLEPRKLMKKVNSDAPAVLADFIRLVRYNVIDSATVQIALVTQASQPDEDFTSNCGYRLYVATERVNLRNIAL
jgi:prepilin-type N-terminal cleavage/methylation domain-containing protein